MDKNGLIAINTGASLKEFFKNDKSVFTQFYVQVMPPVVAPADKNGQRMIKITNASAFALTNAEVTVIKGFFGGPKDPVHRFEYIGKNDTVQFPFPGGAQVFLRLKCDQGDLPTPPAGMEIK